MSDIVMNGDIAFIKSAGAAISFTSNRYSAFQATAAPAKSSKTAKDIEGTSTPLAEITTDLKVAPWGEDNCFPQRIAAQLDYSGVAKIGLDTRAKAIYGAGIAYGTVEIVKKKKPNAEGGNDEEEVEIFKAAPKGKYKEIDAFFEENNNLYRFYLEFLQDWVYFGNCFPEMVTNGERSKISLLIHQESCDCRYKQMDDNGKINTVYISKYWSDLSDQFVFFEKKAALKSTRRKGVKDIDNKYVKQLRCIDMYNSFKDLTKAVKEENRTNIILPVNYPSPNKTYYQLPVWDGSRLSGWLEIAAKVPEMLKMLYKNAFNIKYHIQIPELYFEKRYGVVAWQEHVQKGTHTELRQNLVKEMSDFLSGTENAYKAFISYFDVDRVTGQEYGLIKITPIDNKSNIDKEILASSAANSEILFSMGINPDIIGAGAPGGPYSGSAGSGSNIREAWIVFSHLLTLERKIVLEPLYLVKKFNQWPTEVEFRFKDIVLTRTDANTGSEKKVS